MKLSKAQVKAIESAKKDITEARAYDTWEEWLRATHSYYRHHSDDEIHASNLADIYKEAWGKNRQCIVLTNAGKNTIDALVRLGIFEVVRWGNFRKQGVLDWVKYNEDWEA